MINNIKNLIFDKVAKGKLENNLFLLGIFFLASAPLFGVIFLDGGTGGHEECATFDINGNPACG